MDCLNLEKIILVFVDIIGIIASITSVLGFVPQIYKIHQTKSVQDISILMLLNFLICSAAWVVYGILIGSKYVWVTNLAGLAVSFLLFCQKLYYQK